MFELPQFQEQPRERADAARNRERILTAAGSLVAESGIDAVSMEDVAKAACVGTGTLYRRFGDRAGLAYALLDDQTKDFQNALISGPPPLGPGVPAAERLHAFGAGFLDLIETHAELMVAAAPTVKESSGVLALYATHLRILLAEAAPHLDARYTAESLLAMLDPKQHLRMRHGLGYSLDQLVRGWDQLVDALTRRP
ncbi:TetR/AcrR family transcriptional regulator [Solirubrobacter sp. CPCC 204708]|uniref:TetR/AcrR family transcriptional regulator n=1 Tax=Solirubrobacter deserti TaxID=2282478 RepID=A0ABT4RSZ1_9ACTN|nr:TetR/AcrR family transcriptional regulator [Solirubrobacter deserti]MBE2320943.1 TetR/AcrR family transcriptional regulator [Solirubrobacter deserti]MDA0141661.1 TetR/AcrR family transcriptional regulator [Solirubrobacter deserti]